LSRFAAIRCAQRRDVRKLTLLQASPLDNSLTAHRSLPVRADGTIRHNKGDVMRKIPAIFALIASLALTAPAKKHDSAAKTYDKQGVAIAVPTHYVYSQRVDTIGRHYDWACDADAGNLSCTDNPVSYLTYVRLAADGPIYFALRFSDKQHDAFAPAVLETLIQEKDTRFNYRDYINTAEGLRVICVAYATTDKKGKPKSGETCYTIDTKNPRQMVSK
jgi:hypothetical protein